LAAQPLVPPARAALSTDFVETPAHTARQATATHSVTRVHLQAHCQGVILAAQRPALLAYVALSTDFVGIPRTIALQETATHNVPLQLVLQQLQLTRWPRQDVNSAGLRLVPPARVVPTTDFVEAPAHTARQETATHSVTRVHLQAHCQGVNLAARQLAPLACVAPTVDFVEVQTTTAVRKVVIRSVQQRRLPARKRRP